MTDKLTKRGWQNVSQMKQMMHRPPEWSGKMSCRDVKMLSREESACHSVGMTMQLKGMTLQRHASPWLDYYKQYLKTTNQCYLEMKVEKKIGEMQPHPTAWQCSPVKLHMMVQLQGKGGKGQDFFFFIFHFFLFCGKQWRIMVMGNFG